MIEPIQTYLKRQLAKRQAYFESGPFSVGLSLDSDDPYVNYAVPAAGSEPTPEEVASLAEVFESRSRHPRLEYIPDWAPKVEPALLEAGFSVECRTPLMVCRRIDLSIPTAPPGIMVQTPKSDRDIRHMLAILSESFGSAPATNLEILKLERRIQEGAIVQAAYEIGSRRVVGGGSCTDLAGGITEVVGIAVSHESRGKGIGGYLTAKISEAAFEAGADYCFLMAATIREVAIYGRVGYRQIGQVLHISR